jgi:hypothetical protein
VQEILESCEEELDELLKVLSNEHVNQVIDELI